MKHSIKLIVLATVVSCLLSACSASKDVRQGDFIRPQIDYSSSEQLDYRVVSEEGAVKLAQRHLALKNRSWGKIVDVAEEENRYYVMFETPKREMRLLGQRKLIVQKKNGLVRPHKRR